MIKKYNFSGNSTALPLTKAQRVLRSLGDTDSYSPHFFDDGFPKEILHTDAQAVLNVLDDIAFERDELQAKLAAAETSANELRRAVANLIGADPETWPNHGNAPLAIAACIAMRQAELAALEAQDTRLKAELNDAMATIELVAAGSAAPTSQKPVAEVLLVDGEKVIDASMAFFDSVELGTKLYLAAGAAPVPRMTGAGIRTEVKP